MKQDTKKEIQWLLRDKYHNKKTTAFLRDVESLEKGELIDYLIGWKPFVNCRIDLRFRPLIPRLETEYWAEKAIKEMKSFHTKASEDKIKILDLCAGSGCIGISILKNLKNSYVVFGELDKILIQQIRINLRLNKIPRNRYQIIHSNLFAKVHGRFDFILTNPPYIALERKNKVQKSVLQSESHLALFGGRDGLFLIKKILQQAHQYLNEDGQIWLEFDSFQKPIIDQLLKKLKYKDWQFFKDQFGKWRWVVAR
ncbi:MAG TPA: peptide chain release factor N(5)-glutamine methyltransferase [Candidatus Paceibacterota bacterium]|nr:peptide chain release factor N(5)-glutamine methyltransferase [Candidatus Paceibacterota bacterium]HPT40258.1 peptide chain release factor N(5)-glutamine methyltransferase [Candidatus Paceibacterota bacterium]